MDRIKILERLVSYNTINDQDNLLIMDYVGNYLDTLGFKITFKYNSDQSKKCLIAKYKNPRIAFIGHTDTVGYSNWKYDPFKLTIKDNRLYGLGTCDMKGGIAAFLCAVTEIIDKLENGVMIILTFDEEIGFSGIKLIDDIIPDNVIIGEPTSLVPITNTKGCMEYKVTFKGVRAHSSSPNKGDNAITKCINFISDLRVFYEKLKQEENSLFEIPYTTMNIAKINGGDSINVIPDNCELSFDFRTINRKQNGVINKEIEKLVNKYEANLELITNLYPLDNTSDIAFIENITTKKSAINFVTEASFLDKKNVFILGPGPNNEHKCNEFIDINSYNETIEIYKKIIEFYTK